VADPFDGYEYLDSFLNPSIKPAAEDLLDDSTAGINSFYDSLLEGFVQDTTRKREFFNGIIVRVEHLPAEEYYEPGSYPFSRFALAKKKPRFVAVKCFIPELHNMLPMPFLNPEEIKRCKGNVGATLIEKCQHPVIDILPTFYSRRARMQTPQVGEYVKVTFGNVAEFADGVYEVSDKATIGIVNSKRKIPSTGTVEESIKSGPGYPKEKKQRCRLPNGLPAGTNGTIIRPSRYVESDDNYEDYFSPHAFVNYRPGHLSHDFDSCSVFKVPVRTRVANLKDFGYKDEYAHLYQIKDGEYGFRTSAVFNNKAIIIYPPFDAKLRVFPINSVDEPLNSNLPFPERLEDGVYMLQFQYVAKLYGSDAGPVQSKPFVVRIYGLAFKDFSEDFKLLFVGENNGNVEINFVKLGEDGKPEEKDDKPIRQKVLEIEDEKKIRVEVLTSLNKKGSAALHFINPVSGLNLEFLFNKEVR